MAASTLIFILVLFFSSLYSNATDDADFLRCMSPPPLHTKANYIHPQNSSSYSHLLKSAEQNPRWLNSSTHLKPRFIITPYTKSQIQESILCAKSHGMQLRFKSNGHDYEGLSFLSKSPFVMIDLINLRSISVDMEDESAWVESGATLGELYYAIAKESSVHGFPAGICPSVGIGGHFSGGGIGTMMRKYGLAADNVIDAYIIDVNARILNRSTMGEDLFWAIRGGGVGGSFGIIVSWKIKLVRVPKLVTVFTIQKMMDYCAIKLVHDWQYIAHKLPREVFTRVIIQSNNNNHNNNTKNKNNVVTLFNSLFLGRKQNLITLMNNIFPQLGLELEDCHEMSWIQSVLYFAGYQKYNSLEVLLNRTVQYKSSFKAKSDFVTKNAITKKGLKGIRERVLLLQEQNSVYIILDPMGGKMEEISESEIAYPHRKGIKYNIQYLVKWGDEESSKRHLEWINLLYEFMKPYVSNSPRAAYVNYRDLHIGCNLEVNTNYSKARVWGEKYFGNNFRRLARVKGKVDPENFFRNEQSIPVLEY